MRPAHLYGQDNCSGVYYIPYVLPGPTRLPPRPSGFRRRFKITSCLTASQFRSNFKLDVDPSPKTGEVTAAPRRLDTASGSGGTVIGCAPAEGVPLNGAQGCYMLLAPLLEASSRRRRSAPAATLEPARDVTNAYTLGGGVVGNNQFTLNGTNITSRRLPQNGAGSWSCLRTSMPSRKRTS